jgi:hypothetical protein
MTIFARRAADGGYWVVAIALLGVYCGLRSDGERERRAALAVFFQPRLIAAELTIVEPTDPRSLEALASP